MARSKFILSAAIITFALSYAARCYPARPSAEASLAQQQMQHFDALLNQYSRTKRSVSDYTLLLHVMDNHLSALYRRALRKTASALIHERMMVEAQRLLNHSALGVAQVGYELGFDDTSYLRAPLPQVHQHHTRGVPTALICPVRGCKRTAQAREVLSNFGV